MKVALINPWYDYSRKTRFRINRPWPPLDLAIAASMLEKAGIDAKIIDANALRIMPQDAAKMVQEYDKVFITSSPLDRWQCPDLDTTAFIETSKALKALDKEFYVTGSHCSMRPREMLQATGANAAILGETELGILEICQKPLAEARGIAYFNGGELAFTAPRPLIDVSEMPVPAFHLLPMKEYCYEMLGGNFTILEATRGCPFKCNFCAEDIMYGVQYRKKPLENIKKELLIVVNDFGVKNIYFIDLEFTLLRSYVIDICNMINDAGIKINWACQTRADTIDSELLGKMKGAGCSLIHFGVESGSPKILEGTNKKITLGKIKSGIELTRKAGISSACFFMLGFPGETNEDMEMTLKFAKELNPDYASFHIATPYPGTELYKSVEKDVEGVFPTSYNVDHNEAFLKAMKKKMFMEFYMRLFYILNRLRKNPAMLINQMKLFLNYLS